MRLAIALLGFSFFPTSQVCRAQDIEEPQVERFTKVRLLEHVNGKRKEITVHLVLEARAVRVESTGRSERCEMGNKPHALYSGQESGRTKTAVGATAAVGVLAIPVWFLKGTKHYLVIAGDDCSFQLQLHKSNAAQVLQALERRGVEIRISRLR